MASYVIIHNMQIEISRKTQLRTILIILMTLGSYYFISPKGFTKLTSTNYQGDNLHFSITGSAKVIDGDSIIIKNHEIRILHIDAPEYFQTCQDNKNQEYPCGKLAKDFLMQKLSSHETTCQIKGKDKYKRFLATCENNQQDISKMMIKTGNAIIFNESSFYFEDQEYARINKLGMWQGKFITPRTYRKLHPRKDNK